MDSEDVRMDLVGIFPSIAAANRAAQALGENGIPPDHISLFADADVDPSNIVSSPAFQQFSEDQLRAFERYLIEGHSALAVRDVDRPEEVVTILNDHDALTVETGRVDASLVSRQTIPLYEEQLRVNRELREIGEIVIRKVIEEIPTRAEVDALHEELDIETVSVDEVVEQRREPWREGDVLVVPVYEERLTVVRQLVMREQLRISLNQVTEKHLVEETLRREHAVIEDPDKTGRVRVKRRGAERVEDVDAKGVDEH